MLQKFTNRYVISAVALFAVFAVVFSAFGILGGNLFALAEGIKVWDGSADTKFEGSGTAKDPYKITSAEELYGFVTTYAGSEIKQISDQLYFVLTNDIYLNDVTKSDWTENAPRKWHSVSKTAFNTNTAQGFRGHFDGNGYTVFGLYYASPSSTSYVMGLIPVTSGNAVITNVNLRHSYAQNPSNCDMILGGIVGAVNKNAVYKGSSVSKYNASTVTVTKCVVDESVDFGSVTYGYTGGLVGAVRGSNLVVEYCGSSVKLNNGSTPSGNKGGSIVGNSKNWVVNSYRITHSYCIDTFTTGTVPSASSISDGSLYSANAAWKSNGVKLTVVEAKFMKGATAQKSMPLLDWKIWQVTKKNYPIITGSTAVPENDDEIDDYIGEVGGVWSGEVAARYSGGTGTRKDPYIIETAEQLYKMVSEHCVTKDLDPGAYYKLTADIYLNDVSNPKWYEGTNLNRWYSADFTASNTGFQGNLLGDGHTVYGIYYDLNYGKGGLIPVAAGYGSINDVHVRYSYLNGGKSSGQSYLGGIAGYVQSGSAFKIRRCSVRDTVFGEANAAGGIVGGVSLGNATITSCYFVGGFSDLATYSGGIYGDSWGSTTVDDCYTVGCVSIGKTNGVAGNVRYATVSQKEAMDSNAKNISVMVVSENNIKGENAENTMPLLDWELTWYTVENDYPQLSVLPYESATDGVVGGIWSGKAAEEYAGGTGTQDDPYQIATGEQLYKMVSEHVIGMDTPAYYILTEDIKLNDTSDENWYQKPGNKGWLYTYGIDSAFSGHFDGQGHIVSGLYIKTADSNIKGALFPEINSNATVKNVGVTDSYVDVSTTNNECYGSAIVAYIKNWKEYYDVFERNYPIVSSCFADSSVTVKATFAGGIVAGTPSPVKISNCYYNGKLIGGSYAGALIGNTWYPGCIVENSYAATVNFDKAASGKSDVVSSGVTYKNTFIFGMTEGLGIEFVPINDMLGEAAKSSMPALDFEHIWQTVENTTPILKIFYPRITKGTNAERRTATLSFVTNVEGMSIKPVTAKIGSPLTLPKPVREGYRFEGWYVYPEIQCKFTETTFPYVDTILYANWEEASIIQNFEFYPNSEYDVGVDHEFYRPGVANYGANNVHGGSKAMHRLGNISAEDEFLVNYEEELVVGGEYDLVFWVMTDTADASGDVSIAFKNWPDIAEENNGIEKVMSLDSLKTGEWKQCRYPFVAKSKWISFVTTGNTSIYFDDIIMVRTGNVVHSVSSESVGVKKDLVIQTLPTTQEFEPSDVEQTTNDEIQKENEDTDKDKTVPSVKKKSKTSDSDSDSGFNYVWVIIPIAAVILISGTTLLFILIIKKKNKIK